MLAAAWLGRGFWGLLRGAGRRRPGGGARPLAGRLGPVATAEGRGGGGAGGRRHGNSGVFCLAAAAEALAGPRAAPALRQHQRLLREPQWLLRAPAAAWRLLSGGSAQRRAGSGGAGPPESPRERRVAGRYADLVCDRRGGGGGTCYPVAGAAKVPLPAGHGCRARICSRTRAFGVPRWRAA